MLLCISRQKSMDLEAVMDSPRFTIWILIKAGFTSLCYPIRNRTTSPIYVSSSNKQERVIFSRWFVSSPLGWDEFVFCKGKRSLQRKLQAAKAGWYKYILWFFWLLHAQDLAPLLDELIYSEHCTNHWHHNSSKEWLPWVHCSTQLLCTVPAPSHELGKLRQDDI